MGWGGCFALLALGLGGICARARLCVNGEIWRGGRRLMELEYLSVYEGRRAKQERSVGAEGQFKYLPPLWMAPL